MNQVDQVRRIEESTLFDAGWYLQRYRDVAQTGLSPAEHYLRIGARLLRDPGPGFSTRHYLATHPDVARAGVNPFWHYVAHGRVEGRKIAPSEHALPRPTEPDPVPLLSAEPPGQRPARVIAFYLPQFHPIPENDAWWGEGFTEWTNVRPAKPQFIRHYQPHVPAELGYYDLRDVDAQRRQVELAKRYGIEGFCFYFYWFAGQRLLETPIRNYLDTPGLELPFCLCWANENWSRRWDGRDQDILMAQQHSPEDDLGFIAHVAQYMRDPRYIRIDGKPLLLVYRPNLLPDAAATALRWRQWCIENEVGEIYLAYTQSFESNDPRDYGFDAAIEFPPNNSGVPLVTAQYRANPDFQGRIFDWSALVERSYAYPTKPYPLFRGICPSWDNTARRGTSGTILANSTPAGFTRWATHAIRDTRARFNAPDERLVFVNAWNEWAEGAHLEPDQRYGHAWLESIRVALACSADGLLPSPDSPRVAAVVDAAQACGIREAVDACLAVPADHRLFVSARRGHADDLRAQLERAGRDHVVVATSGAERMPLLAFLPLLRAEGFDFVLHLRASPPAEAGRPDAAEFAEFAEFAKQAAALFAADATLGMVCAARQRFPDAPVSASLLQVGGRLGLRDDEVRDHATWRGDAFLARVAALAPLESLAFPDDAFRPECRGYKPGLADAIKRGTALSVVAAGLRVADQQAPFDAARRPRMIVTSHDAHPHGAQLLSLNMARTFRDMGFDVDMIVLGPGRLLDRFREVATVHQVDLDRDPPWKVQKLLAALHAAGADVAIANTTVSGLLVPLLKQAGLRVVSLIHELPGILGSYRLEAHARAIVEHADAVVFPAQIVKRGFEAFVGGPVKQAAIRPQGLYLRTPHATPAARDAMRAQVRERLGLAPGARIILCSGYADHRKGLDLFAETCLEVMRNDPRAVAVWIGHADEALLEKVRASIRQAGAGDRFVFTGLVDNPEDYYAAADVYALTSREDPFPSVVMEALDARVPVVSFAGVVGSEELLARGTGLLVPAFDTGKMAAAIRRLLDDTALAERLAGRGKDIIDAEFGFRHYLFDLAGFAGKPIPRVSVVVPNYNYAGYLRERLDSIQRQAGPVYELIVLDDASSDDSVQVIRDFLGDCSIPSRLIVNERNSGSVFRQWQLGVELAGGDFVWIAEADDLADPEFLANVLPAFSDPDVVMSYAQSRQMRSDGRITCEHYLDYVADIDAERWTRPYVVEGTEEISTALYLKNTIPNVSAVVFRRDALKSMLDEHAGEICSFRNAGDWVAYLRLLEKGSVAFNPKSLNSHRRHQRSVTVGNFNLAQLQEIVRVQNDTIARHRLGGDAVDRAVAYAQSLYRQFGLASEQHPRFNDHPALARLA